jgi:hypothetical protein
MSIVKHISFDTQVIIGCLGLGLDVRERSWNYRSNMCRLCRCMLCMCMSWRCRLCRCMLPRLCLIYVGVWYKGECVGGIGVSCTDIGPECVIPVGVLFVRVGLVVLGCVGVKLGCVSVVYNNEKPCIKKSPNHPVWWFVHIISNTFPLHPYPWWPIIFRGKKITVPPYKIYVGFHAFNAKCDDLREIKYLIHPFLWKLYLNGRKLLKFTQK